MSSNYGTLEISCQNRVDKRNNAESKGETKGLSLFTATLFIAGEMAGSGVLALPKAIVRTGFIGTILLLVFCFNAVYGGIRLGNCWNIVEERFHEHRTASRNPYAVIASKAVGQWGSILVSYCIRITLFGAGTVYLMLSSHIVQALCTGIFPNLDFCTCFIVISICITPVMWLGSPKEFSIVGMGAVLTTVVACVLYFIQICRDAYTIGNTPRHTAHGFYDFFLSFGTILFAFGGASTFPTIQNDMEDKRQFSKSVSIALGIILLLYLPITVGGYFVYGDDVNTNFTQSLTRNVMTDIANVLMAMHLIFAFLIVTNTVCQDVEENFGIPRHFGWKRCLLRTSIMLGVIIVGEAIPEFGKILALIGGSTIALLTFVFPPYFYKELCDRESPEWKRERYIPFYERVYIWELIFIGIIGGGASTFSAFKAIFSHESHIKPCLW